MNNKHEMVALLLAGGKGTRLHQLTKKVAKPAVFFGGKYRIIDFALSNCANSNINIVGVVTQYESVQLNAYIGAGTKWGLDGNNSKAVLLPPRQKEIGMEWFNGTADAVYQNLDFCDAYDPDYLLVLSGDHIYKMNYAKMLRNHKKSGADVTIAALEVPWEDASRYGILNVDENDVVTKFDEKPKNPKSNLASMGIYIFSYNVLKQYLEEDSKINRKEHDFGMHILPTMLNTGKKICIYRFDGYWRDVGTVSSLWQANMDLLDENTLDIYNKEYTWKILSEDTHSCPQYIASTAKVRNSMINQGCYIEGEIYSSVLFADVKVGKNSKISECVVMPGVEIGENVEMYRCIIDSNVKIENNSKINVGNNEPIIVSEGE